ncbi:hypothetical protein pb186bvf_017077 [Paramecium bursaria]
MHFENFTKQVKHGYKPSNEDEGIIDKDRIQFADKKPVKSDSLNPRNPVKEEYMNYQFQNQAVVIIQNPNQYPPVIPNLIAEELGLPNIGNTCYMNSVLQILLRATQFIDALGIFIESSIFIQLCISLSQKLLQKQEINREELVNLKNMISQINPQFIGTEQQDSSELLLCLLNKLNDDSTIQQIRNVGLQQRFDDMHNQDFRIQQYLEQKHNQNFVFANLINIHFQIFYKCSKCYKTRYEFETQMTLDINIPSGKDILSIIDLISAKISELKLECQQCMKSTIHQKVSKIIKLPKYLIINLRRYKKLGMIDKMMSNKIYKKNTQKIQIEPVISFTNQMVYQHPSKYFLRGFVDHKGTEESGHYTAYFFTQQWHFFNDQQVQKCPVEVVYNILRNNQSAYNLLYELY